MTRGPLLLYTRVGCGLCDELRAELARLAPDLVVELVDIDRDPVLQRRYGLHVPVLMADGLELCRHHLDARAVLDWLALGTDGIPGGSRS